MAYLRSGIDGGRQGGSLVRNRVMDIRGDLATGGRLVLSTTEPTVVDGNELGRIDFQAPLDTAGTDAILVAASIYAEADNTFSSSVNATELCFAVGKSETAAEKMRLDQDGQLGIGVATPASLLHVAGTVQVGVDGTGHDVKFFGDTASKFMLWDESRDALVLQDATALEVGTGYDASFRHNGSNAYLSNATGIMYIASETSGIAVKIGHTTSETTIQDNLTVTGTLDVTDAFVFNEAGADIDFRVESSGDANMFFVDGAGPRIYLKHNASINIGGASRTLTMHHATADNTNGIAIMHWGGANSTRGNISIGKSLGTSIGSYTAVTDGRQLGAIEFYGADGDTFELGAQIQAEAAETFSDSARGSEMTFHTVDNTTTTLDERMRIAHDGKVGIGTNAPRSPIHLHASASDFDPASHVIISSSSIATGDLMGIGFNQRDENDAKAWFGTERMGDYGVSDFVFLLDNAGDDNPVAAGDEVMRITRAGLVGIGVATPASLLHVAGTVQVGVDDTGHDVKFFGATSGSYMLWDESTDRLLLTDDTQFRCGDGGDLQIYHNGTASYISNLTGALNIADQTSGIAVNIGHTTSETTINDNLTVTGSVSVGILGINLNNGGKFNSTGTNTSTSDNTGNSGGGLSFKNTSDTDGNFNDIGNFASTGLTTSRIVFMTNDHSGRYGSIHFKVSAANYPITKAKLLSDGDWYTNDGDVSSLSDVRIKKDIEDLTDGLDIINQLKPRTYRFNGKGDMQSSSGDSNDVTRYGFIADEVLSVASQYIKVEAGKIDGVEQPDVKSMSKTKFIPMMVKAIQELSTKVTALENA